MADDFNTAGDDEATPSGEHAPAPPQDAGEPSGGPTGADRPGRVDADGTGADDTAAIAASLLEQVHAAVNDANSSSSSASAGAKPPPPGSAPMSLPAFEDGARVATPAELELLADVNLDVKIELGRTRMLVEDVLKLSDGAVVELDKLAGDPVDIYVNERHVARGEVLVLNDNFCVRINEIVDPDERKAG